MNLTFQDGILLLWPVTVAHRIDKSSPFYSMGPREILAAKFELVVVCGGNNETNGSSVQVRVLWLVSRATNPWIF